MAVIKDIEDICDSIGVHNISYLENSSEESKVVSDSNSVSWDKCDILSSLMKVDNTCVDIVVEDKGKKKKEKRDAKEINKVETISNVSNDTQLLSEVVKDKYRRFGHLNAKINPLNNDPEKDLDIGDNESCSSLRKEMRDIYCSSIGAEFMHLESDDERNWISSYMENTTWRDNISTEDRKFILRHIIESEKFEQFLHKKFVGAKRFSGEGLESVVVCLEKIKEICANDSVEELLLAWRIEVGLIF